MARNEPEHEDQAASAELEPTIVPPASTTALATQLTPAQIQQLLAPYQISLDTWLVGLLSDDDFPEMDPDDMAKGMIAQILLAETSEQALAAFDLDRARDMCGNEPGGRSPVLEITGARPMKSEYAEGAACYVIVSAVRLVDGERIQFTTGARAVQAVILKHIHEGWMPFRAMLEIRKERTRRGFYPLNLVSGI